MANEYSVVIIGGGMSALEATPHLLKKSPKATVAVITGNSFLEFPMGASIFLHDPSEHRNHISGDPANWKNKDKRMTYFHDGVDSVDCDNKTITLGNKTTIKYKAVVVATGSKMPLIAPKVGATLTQRHEEVRAYSAACAKAKTVVFNGPGLIGVEFCGDFRVSHGYNARVILLTRSGKILDTDFGEKSEKPRLDFVEHVSSILRDKFKVEIKKGSPADAATFSQPQLSPGTLRLDSGDEIQYDLYMPTYGQGANTDMLMSKQEGFLEGGRIKSNDCLQSTVHPEVFGVNVTTTKLYGHPLSSRVTAAAKTCAENAALVAEGKQPKPHVDKEGPPPMTYPMNVKIGHGAGGYMIWTDLGPAALMCCQPCKGGFPFCPPPCCWPILKGSMMGCGYCGGDPEGEGPAIFLKYGMLPKFAPAHKYFGIGKLGPDAPAQLKM